MQFNVVVVETVTRTIYRTVEASSASEAEMLVSAELDAEENEFYDGDSVERRVHSVEED